MAKKNPLVIGAIVVIIAIAGYFLIRANNQKTALYQATLDTSNAIDTTAQLPTTTKETSGSGSTTTPPVKTPPAPQSSIYKDGTYIATGSYISPGGKQGLEVTVTIQNDVIVASNIVAKAIDEDSDKFQRKFIAAYKQLVIGKNIDTVKLSKVSGASLTGAGFNDALAKIKAQAKS